jgi:hypothetical protein
MNPRTAAGLLALSAPLVMTAWLAASAAPASTGAVDGLWRYQTIATGAGTEVPIDGLFLFRAGRFVQQSLNVGEPFDKQLAQAHAGTYEVNGRALKMFAEVGLVVNPAAKSPVDVRRNSEHHVTIDRDGDRLTLTFSTGTVQKFTRVGPAHGEVYRLDRGAFALADGKFILVAETSNDSVGASGAFEKTGSTLHLRPDRWFTIHDGRAVYARDPVDATFDGKTLTVQGVPAIHVKP